MENDEFCKLVKKCNSKKCATSERAYSDLLQHSRRFLQSLKTKYCHYIDRDEAESIALASLYEASQRFDPSRCAWLGFLGLVFQRKIYTYFSWLGRKSAHPKLPVLSIDASTTVTDPDLCLQGLLCENDPPPPSEAREQLGLILSQIRLSKLERKVMWLILAEGNTYEDTSFLIFGHRKGTKIIDNTLCRIRGKFRKFRKQDKVLPDA